MNASIILKKQQRPYWRLSALALVAAIFGAFTLAWPDVAAAPSHSSPVVVPITGTYIDVEGATGALQGSFSGERLVVAESGLGFIGILSIALIDESGKKFATLDQPLTLPVADLATTPTSIVLTLGPGSVVVAGLQVYFDRVIVDLAAAQGPARQLAVLLSGADESSVPYADCN